ncbi:hypothetical protein BU26DRAFT_153545 [Trematosphaeria pertusa]|uniref:Uncharacterized protein n=1 Tax=Trematosphaeria pertusa TaxID=390896 RepID=A0A6A6J1I1_9PLEO|nr:uncharacterized protein BU26DRAFT_153545 [Trematosphaeria pertusa]KAF2255303.1 hypothetical protein BU26DRAFT_153545 [Trematosphaeria pertusa]
MREHVRHGVRARVGLAKIRAAASFEAGAEFRVGSTQAPRAPIPPVPRSDPAGYRLPHAHGPGLAPRIESHLPMPRGVALYISSSIAFGDTRTSITLHTRRPATGNAISN